MTINHSNVDVTTDNFSTWIQRTNQMLTALRTNIVTTDSNATVGNAEISGTFTANVVTANTITGYVIGTNIQAQNQNLQTIADLSLAADKLIYFSNTSNAVSADLTPFARTLLDDTTPYEARQTLNVVSDPADIMGSNVSLDLILTDESGLIGSFTRASVGTRYNSAGTLVVENENIPRFDHDPVTLDPRGILIEAESTNIITYSEQFDNAIWNKAAVSVTADQVVAPDGNTVADKLIESVATNEHFIQQAHAAITGVNTHSVYAKAGERFVMRMRPVHVGESENTSHATFNIQTGAILSQDGALLVDAAIESVGDGWYRCSITVNTTGVATTSTFRIHVLDDTSNINYTGDGTSGFYIWGAQLEEQSYMSSYIPTVASAVTRSPDVYTITDLGWYNNDGGTVYVEYETPLVGSAETVWALSDGTNSNRIMTRTGGSNRLFVSTGGVTQAAITVGSDTADSTQKVAVAFQADDFAVSAFGGNVVTDSSGTIPVVDQLTIGSGPSGALEVGHVKRLIYTRDRVSDADLEDLTR